MGLLSIEFYYINQSTFIIKFLPVPGETSHRAWASVLLCKVCQLFTSIQINDLTWNIRSSRHAAEECHSRCHFLQLTNSSKRSAFELFFYTPFLSFRFYKKRVSSVRRTGLILLLKSTGRNKRRAYRLHKWRAMHPGTAQFVQILSFAHSQARFLWVGSVLLRKITNGNLINIVVYFVYQDFSPTLGCWISWLIILMYCPTNRGDV